jgi:hypothetical protein
MIDNNRGYRNLVLLGTAHEIQEKDFCDSQEFRRFLSYIVSKRKVDAILEEWWMGRPPTIGYDIANTLSTHWANVGTPDEPEFQTLEVGLASNEIPPISLPRYGPLDVQLRRENYMVHRIEVEMSGRNCGLVVCGIAHLHSLFEKLVQSGFHVEAFTWLGH